MRQKGFSLIEIIIYTALASTTLAAMFLIYTSALETHSYVESQRLLLDVERPIELQVRSRLQEAPSVTTPASGTSTSLVVGSEETGENPVTFSVSNGVLQMQLGTGAPLALTPSDVTVTAFTATRSTGTPASILVSITLETSATGVEIARTFSFFVTLRYE